MSPSLFMQSNDSSARVDMEQFMKTEVWTLLNAILPFEPSKRIHRLPEIAHLVGKGKLALLRSQIVMWFDSEDKEMTKEVEKAVDELLSLVQSPPSEVLKVLEDLSKNPLPIEIEPTVSCDHSATSISTVTDATYCTNNSKRRNSSLGSKMSPLKDNGVIEEVDDEEADDDKEFKEGSTETTEEEVAVETGESGDDEQLTATETEAETTGSVSVDSVGASLKSVLTVLRLSIVVGTRSMYIQTRAPRS